MTPDEQRAAWGLRPLSLRERLRLHLGESEPERTTSPDLGEPHPASDREGTED